MCWRATRKGPSRMAVAFALPLAPASPGHALTGPSTARHSSSGRHLVVCPDALEFALLVCRWRLTMTNHRVENGRRNFLLTIAGGIAGLAVGSGPARVLAQPAGGPPLSISTIGAGREGGALGALFVKAGHPVMFSSRHPDTLKGLVDELGPLARAGTVAEAVEFGDVVMVVVPYTAMEQIGKDYGNALAKKVLVIDVSNPIARRDGAEIVKWVNEQGGAGLATAKLLLGAHIVPVFNAINYSKLSADAHRQGELVGVPIAGDDPHAIEIASTL